MLGAARAVVGVDGIRGAASRSTVGAGGYRRRVRVGAFVGALHRVRALYGGARGRRRRHQRRLLAAVELAVVQQRRYRDDGRAAGRHAVAQSLQLVEQVADLVERFLLRQASFCRQRERKVHKTQRSGETASLKLIQTQGQFRESRRRSDRDA